MIRALDPLFLRNRRKPGSEVPATRIRHRPETPSLVEPNRFENADSARLWSAPAHWRL